MKFFCKITLIIFFIFSIINTVKAENEIDKLELIERYIVNYKKNISLVVTKYEIKDNKDIKDTINSFATECNNLSIFFEVPFGHIINVVLDKLLNCFEYFINDVLLNITLHILFNASF